MDEDKLVMLAKQGNLTAFEELFKANREKIYRLAYGFVKNTADAEDLLQETFFKAFLAIKNFKPKKRLIFSTWLYRIGINCSISFLRKHKKQKEKNQDIFQENPVQFKARHPNPETLLETEEMHRVFKNELDTLSSKQRTIIVLRYYNGLKVKEIAEKMRCSEGSVKKQLFRAFSKLKKQLNFLFCGEIQ